MRRLCAVFFIAVIASPAMALPSDAPKPGSAGWRDFVANTIRNAPHPDIAWREFMKTYHPGFAVKNGGRANESSPHSKNGRRGGANSR